MADVCIIQDFEKNGDKKNVATLREKIIALVAEHPRYPRNLYDTCARGGTFKYFVFRDLLNKMVRDGEIRINANNLVMMPEPPPETKPSPANSPYPTSDIENRTEPTSITADKILEHCRQRAQTKAGDCLFPVERDAHIGNRSRGIYLISRFGR